MAYRNNRSRRHYGGTGDPYSRQGRGTGTGRFKLMLIIGVGMALFQAFKYYSNTQTNTITGEEQRVQWTVEEEVSLGLQSAPQMAKQHGGLHADTRAQDYLDRVGERLVNSVNRVMNSDYRFDFHLLADPNTVNAFALPGGQVFITQALFERLGSEDQLAGVIGHEIGHVVHRHGAERMAKSGFIQGLIQSVMIGSGGGAVTNVAQMIGQYTSMKYGRDQELESDDYGVYLMIEAGYNAMELIKVMDILEEASGGSKQPEFQSTHPSPENRRGKIKEAFDKYSRN